MHAQELLSGGDGHEPYVRNIELYIYADEEPDHSNKPYILSILSYMHVIYENIHKRVFCFYRSTVLCNRFFPDAIIMVCPRQSMI